MNIVILGPQGSGKGTQAKLIAEYFGLTHVDMGAQLRQVAAEDSDRGKRIREIMDVGDLVPIELTVEIFSEALSKPDKGFVIEGFPRTQEQLAAIKDRISFDLAVFIDVSDEESMKRIIKRVELEGRSDDTPEAIARRLEIYHTQTELLLRDYTDQGILVRIDGEQTPEEVFADIRDAIEDVQ
ncbi:MAG: adenylate kinase family protein [Candidatus Woesearchaeota archaeon]